MILWTVTFETVVPVVADTEDAALKALKAAVRDMHPSDFSAFVSRVPPGSRATGYWPPDARVYGTDEDITLAEAERRNGEGES